MRTRRGSDLGGMAVAAAMALIGATGLAMFAATAASAACPGFGVDVALTAGGSFTPAVNTDYSLSGATGTGYDFVADPGISVSILNAAQITASTGVSVTSDGGDTCFEDIAGATITAAGEGLMLRNLDSGNIVATVAANVTASAANGIAIGAANLVVGSTTGNFVIATSGNLTARLYGIYAANGAAATGDIDITTAAGTTITTDQAFGSGILAIRSNPIAANPSGSIRIINAANIVSTGSLATGINAQMCDCTTGAVSVVNRGNITAETGIRASSTTTVSVEHLAGTITSSTVGIEVGGMTTSGQATVPVSVTVGAGATIIGDIGIGIMEQPFPGAFNPATIIVAGTVSSTGTDAIVLANASTNRIELHPTYAITGLVDGVGSNDTLALGGAGMQNFALGLLATQFTAFEALEKTGASTWTLSGTNAFTGPTNVLAGTLSLGNGASLPGSTVTVNGGTLAGNGTIGGLIANGVVAPGDSIGTITVVGTATFNAGATYAVEVDPTTSDLTTANAAVINGGTVAVTVLSGNYAPVSQYTIVSTTGGVTGQFGGVSVNSGFFTPTLSRDANNVYLTLNLNTSAGDIHASLLGGFIESDQLRIAALDRAGAALDGLTPVTPTAYLASALPAGTAPANGLWGRAYGAVGQLFGNATAATLGYGEGGIFAGADAPVGDWVLGAIAGAGLTRVSVPAHYSNASSTDLSLALYGGAESDIGTLKLGAGYTHHLVATTRTTGVPGATDVFAASYGAGLAQIFAEASKTVDLGAQELTPFAGIAAMRAMRGAFAESGGAGAVMVAASTYDALVTTLGIKAEHQFTIGDGRLATASASAAWRHVAAGDPTIAANFAGGAPFMITGAAPGADALLLTGGIGLDLSSQWTLDLSYRGAFAPGSLSHSATATLAASF